MIFFMFCYQFLLELETPFLKDISFGKRFPFFPTTVSTYPGTRPPHIYLLWAGFVAQEFASFLFGQYPPTFLQFYMKGDGVGLHQDTFYPRVTQLSCL